MKKTKKQTKNIKKTVSKPFTQVLEKVIKDKKSMSFKLFKKKPKKEKKEKKMKEVKKTRNEILKESQEIILEGLVMELRKNGKTDEEIRRRIIENNYPTDYVDSILELNRREVKMGKEEEYEEYDEEDEKLENEELDKDVEEPKVSKPKEKEKVEEPTFQDVVNAIQSLGQIVNDVVNRVQSIESSLFRKSI